jgi:FkbM family methyltransferase
MRRRGLSAFKKLRATMGFIGFVQNWGDHYVATYGSARPALMTYRLRNGLQLEARPRTLDVAVLKDVFSHHVYTPRGFEIEANSIVLDVGAHVGAFAASAARSAAGVTVYAFEPSPENFALLSSNMARNGLSNVLPAQCAVAGGGGVRQLHVSDSPAEHSLHIVKPGAVQLPVSSITLAEIIEQHAIKTIDLLKMDCEGAEYEILEAAVGQGALQRVRRVALEAHVLDASRSPSWLVALLRAQGFHVRAGFEGTATSMIWASRA